jgi:hypothetical protein
MYSDFSPLALCIDGAPAGVVVVVRVEKGVAPNQG